MTRFSTTLGLGALAATAAVLTACGGGGSTPDGQGSIRVALTDAPACGFEQVNVTVRSIQVNRTTTTGESGWETLQLDRLQTPKRVNLLDLTNGVLEELGQARLPAGTYRQIRLVLAEGPQANTVKPVDGAETPLQTPSAQQSGLKLQANFDVEPGKVADVVLDFDACKSVVTRGKSGGYNLKPVVSVLPRVTDAGLAVQGSVPAGASVSLQQQGSVVRSTVASSAGSFVLSPVPAGNYDLVVSAEGRVTAVMTGVPVVRTERTLLAAIDPPVNTTMRTVSGTVSIASTPPTFPGDAVVRALQAIPTVGGGSTKVEVAGRPAEAETGAYSLLLPTGAPVRVAYSPGATSWNFTPDSTVAGKYVLEAAVPDKTPQTRNIDLGSGNLSENFTFAP